METNNQKPQQIFIALAVTFTIIALIATAVVFVNKSSKKESAATEEKKENMTNETNNNSIKLTDRTVKMETNFGTLNIKMLDKAAPRTTENFIRLSDKGYYDGLAFHRIAKSPNFMIIQGGDPRGNGTGGESIFGKSFEDEVYKKGTRELVDANLYSNYNGQYAVYKKGLIAMANSGPNTNGSQFFIMLDDTFLPPAYTIFGQISEADFGVLDKIASEVNPSTGNDGRPNKELKIVKAVVE